jgi:hypothetical protein
MVNNILNITANGNFQEVTGIPHECRCLAIQARTSVAINVHWRGQTTLWTIKAGTVKTLIGQFNSGDLFVQSTNGVIVEIECATGTANQIFQG